MVAEVRPNYESDYAAITAVALKLGIGAAETRRKWATHVAAPPLPVRNSGRDDRTATSK
jgi:hypothetical protein